jgi:hypothetical protein
MIVGEPDHGRRRQRQCPDKAELAQDGSGLDGGDRRRGPRVAGRYGVSSRGCVTGLRPSALICIAMEYGSGHSTVRGSGEAAARPAAMPRATR